MSNFNKDLQNYKSTIDQSLLEIYKVGPKLLKDPINHIIKGGKRLRPILCMMTAKSLGVDYKKSIDCSVSIELLHIFSLIHDDIMDDDNLRHGDLTIHKKWNLSIGILSGDAVLALAFNRLNKVDNKIKELFNSALIAVCEGQALDLEYETRNDISINEYLKMINLKTSHMIGLCSRLGSIIANTDNNTVDTMNKFGELLGIAFQIQDDILEIVSDVYSMGKNLNSDIILNKKTFLYVKAMEMIPDKINEVIFTFKNDEPLMIEKYKETLIKEGVVEFAQSYANKIFLDAKSCLDKVKLEDDNLEKFINYIRNRKC